MLERLEELKVKKKEGYDVSFDFDSIKHKFQLVNEMKDKITADLEKKKLIIKLQSVQEKEIKKVSDNSVKPKQDANEASARISDPLNEKLFNHLLKSNRVFDILYLFHAYNLNYPDMSLISYFSSRASKYPNIRFSIGYYTDKTLFISLFKESSKQQKEMKPKPFNEIIDIRQEILNLDWESKTKLVFNFVKKSFIDQFKQSKIEPFLNLEDSVKSLLKHKNIQFQRCWLEDAHITKKIINEVTSEAFLLKSATDQNRITYFRNLYLLKRNLFQTFDEFLEKKSEKSFPVNYNELGRNFKEYSACNFGIFIKETELAPIKLEKTEKHVFIKLKDKIVNQTKNFYLISAKCENGSILWLEILESEESLKRILDIHLTAKFFIDNFNDKCSTIDVKISSIYRLFLDPGKFIIASRTNKNIDDSEIKILSQSAIDMNESLSHYSYEKSRHDLVLFDLRPIQEEKNKFLITEPVIFSLVPNKFGSSDLGIKGIEKFKMEHQCNSICRELKLKSF